MSKTWNWLKKEFREILPVWAFFFFAMGLLSFTVSAVLGQYHIELARPHEYLVGSLIMAKVVLLMDAFVSKEWLRGRPLIYPTLWNTGVYFLAALAFNNLERLFSLMRRQHFGFDQATREILSHMAEPRYWAVMTWLIALIVVFCGIRELIDSIGSDRFKEMFFGKRSDLRQRPGGPPSAAA
jgi:hypothetical protein